MPTYDYRCNACGHEFELFQQMSAAVKKKCPECGKLKLERLIGTGAAVLFKGGGFYETDYRSDSYKADARKATSDSKPKETKSESKSGSDASSKSGDKKSSGGSSTKKSKKD